MTKLEWSAAEEACQVLVQELNSLPARNEELEKKLNDAYHEIARLKGGNSRASRVPPRVIIGYGIQTEADEMQDSVNMGTQTATDDDALILHSHPYPVLVSDDGECGGQDPHKLRALSGAVGSLQVEHVIWHYQRS